MSIDNQFPEERMAHDQWFFFLASTFGKVVHVEQPLVAYVQHGRNVFGWGRRPSSLEKIRSLLFNNPAERYATFATIAENRAAILDVAKSSVTGVWRERADKISENYRQLASFHETRKILYKSPRVVDRLSMLCDLYAKGGYRESWGLGRNSLLKDLCLGVPLGRFLRSSTKVF
jgi:hypothetical protein